ncbi:MAG: hypothetical protein K2X56_00435 [Mycobacterium pseudokansasii]|uniref:hypothetical protein n=1 Tax=Mycobacterium pseudokansasii TaxID=2341080 RepID=UPI0007B516BF|nr:hypothetical protein [Mycobacterium pseudokansasii]KZS62619.1 hypothetical protein A4G27_13205 [Mycobacterium kansasii]MBY0386598.1 hypothetical protein [Mycobacterium pseudokansasii]VAZ86900.1 hypothetical protein LAUMK35_00010 [Mycobacterium pseudokansasii]VAZ87244.1 hypothetical protein LAUMK21_00009 [Mycobacterium pseudokansasii]
MSKPRSASTRARIVGRAAATTVLVSGCGMPSGGGTAASSPGTTTPSTADSGSSAVEQDVVVRLDTAQPDRPVGVHFGRHPAIYLLERDDPHFATWLAVLQRSLNEGT